MTIQWDFDTTYDLEACLRYNPQPFAKDDVEGILAVVEGENDERPWWWILSLTDGRFAMLTGSCDYTGWDCQSGASSEFAATPEEAVDLARNHPDDDWSSPASDETCASLLAQLTEGRTETRREKVAQDLFG